MTLICFRDVPSYIISIQLAVYFLYFFSPIVNNKKMQVIFLLDRPVKVWMDIQTDKNTYKTRCSLHPSTPLSSELLRSNFPPDRHIKILE